MSRLRADVARCGVAGLVALAAATSIAAVSRQGAPVVAASKRVGAWRELPPGQLTRTEAGAARIGGFIYVVGGLLQDASTTPLVERYELATGGWTLTAPMPVAVNHPAVAALEGKLYVFGGYTNLTTIGGEIDALQRFDPATGVWTQLRGSGNPRGAATLAPLGRRLYAIGGAHAGGEPLSLVQSYDPRKERWRRERSMRVAREHLASAVVKKTIIVLGGRASGRNLSTVERFLPKTRRWARLRSLRTPRSGFAAAAVRGRVIAVGGEQLAEGDSTIASVEIFGRKRGRWSALPPMITPRHGLGVVSAGYTLFALEGGPRPGGSFSNANEAIRLSRGQLGLRRP